MTARDIENLKDGAGDQAGPRNWEVGAELDRVAWCSWGGVNWNPDLSQTFSISLEKGTNISTDLKGRTKRERETVEYPEEPLTTAPALKMPEYGNLINTATKRLSPS